MLLANRNIVVSLPVQKRAQESELEQAVLRFQAIVEHLGQWHESGEFRLPKQGESLLGGDGIRDVAKKDFSFLPCKILNPPRRLTFADFHIFEDQFGTWQLAVAGNPVASSTHEGPLKVLAATLKSSAQVEQSHANELRIQEVIA